MIRDITLGQYYSTESIIHKIDPRVKIISTFVYLISLFIFKSLAGYILVSIFLIIIIKLSKVPFKFVFRGMRSIIFLLLITVVFNIFLTPGTSIIKIWHFSITKEGIKIAVFMGLRLFFLITGTQIMTLTTTPSKLTNGLESILKPLRYIKVPVGEIALMMTIALRFLPILLDETNKIINAQVSRGADIETGGIIKKTKAMIPILIPLFIQAFRKASDLALAMEARCYNNSETRTKLNPLVYARKDYLSYLVMCGYLSIIILIRVSLEKYLTSMF